MRIYVCKAKFTQNAFITARQDGKGIRSAVRSEYGKERMDVRAERTGMYVSTRTDILDVVRRSLSQRARTEKEYRALSEASMARKVWM
ncbi:MAG: hypothetical protein ACYCX4_12435 [Bacillota bacterium]